MSSSYSDDQLQSDDTLDDRGVDDVLDEGMSPPEHPSRAMARGTTAAEDAAGETIDERLEQEEPDPVAHLDYSAPSPEDEPSDDDANDDVNDDPSDRGEIGDERTGRLVADEDGIDGDGIDAGIDAGAASAEEAAMHTVDEDEI